MPCYYYQPLPTRMRFSTTSYGLYEPYRTTIVSYAPHGLCCLSTTSYAPRAMPHYYHQLHPTRATLLYLHYQLRPARAPLFYYFYQLHLI